MLSVFRFHAVVFSKSIHLSPLQFYFIIFVCVCCAAAGIRQVTVMSMKASTTLACWRRCWMRAKNMYLFLTLITWELLSTSVSLHVYVCVWSVIHHHHQTTGLKSRCHSENRFGALYKCWKEITLGKKLCWKRCVFKSRLKVGSDEVDDTECGRAFQARAAATGNDRSPSVEQRVAGTISCDVAAKRRCRWVVTSDTRWKLLDVDCTLFLCYFMSFIPVLLVIGLILVFISV